MQIYDGFPADTAIGPDGKGKGFLMRFNPKTLLMPDDYFDAGFLSHTKLSTSPPTYRYSFDMPQPAGKVGDYVAVRHFFVLVASVFNPIETASNLDTEE